VSTSAIAKPSGSLTLRNAEAAHGVMYVFLFENVGSGKAAVSEESDRKKPPSFFVVSRFPCETTRPFLRFHLVGFGGMFTRSTVCGILPNWQSPRPSPFLTLPLRRRVFEDSISQRRPKESETEIRTAKQSDHQQTKISPTESNQKPPRPPTAKTPRPAVIIH